MSSRLDGGGWGIKITSLGAGGRHGYVLACSVEK